MEPIAEEPEEIPNILDKSFQKSGPKSYIKEVSTPPISFLAKYE